MLAEKCKSARNRVALVLLLIVQNALTAKEAGGTWSVASFSSIVIAVQVLGGFVLVQLSRRFVAIRNPLTLAIGSGTLVFTLSSIFVSPTLTFIMFVLISVIALLVLWKQVRNLVIEQVGVGDGSGITLLVLAMTTVQFLFLSQFQWRFFVGGLVVFVATVAIFVVSRHRESLILPASVGGFVIWATVHLWLLASSVSFSIGKGSYFLPPDAADQVAMAQGLVKFGAFDSPLMAGVADKYHWLSWAWIGSVGMLSGGDYWMAAEVTGPVGAATLFSLSVLGLIARQRVGSLVWAAGVLCILVSDSALENIPTVDFGGSSGYLSHIWLLMLVPVAAMTMEGRLVSAQFWGIIGLVGSLMGKATYGLVFLVTHCLIGVLTVFWKRMDLRRMSVLVFGPLGFMATYWIFLRSSEISGGANVGLNPKTTVLGYRLFDQVDLMFRVMPLLCVSILLMQRLPSVLVVSALAALVSFGSIFLLDVWGSGPMSLFWAGSLFAGLSVWSVIRIDTKWEHIVIGGLSLVVGVYSSIQTISWQWVDPIGNGAKITDQLWISLVILLVVGTCVPLIRSSGSSALKTSATGVLIACVFFNAGVFGAQTFRNQLRPLADQRYGVVGRVSPVGTDLERMLAIKGVASFLEARLVRDEIYATNAELQGPLFAAFSGERSLVEGSHHSHGSPMEYEIRQRRIESFTNDPSESEQNWLECSGVKYFVFDLRKNLAVKSDLPEVFRNQHFSVVELSPSRRENGGCDR